MREDLHAHVATAMRQAADTAILPRFRRLATHEIVEKSPGEVVTQADRDAEAMLTPVLLSLLPGSRVVGEEAAATDPDLLANLDKDHVWLVDPLDGTRNFADGRGPFAVMVALLDEGITTASWILNPLTGDEYFAHLGHGAFKNGERLTPSPGADPAPAADQLHGAIFTRFLPADVRAIVDQNRPRLGPTTSGMYCAGAEYPALVHAEQDFALFWRTLPWDHAPGALLLMEAGGHVARLDGTAYQPGDAKTGLLVARTPACWQTIRSALLD